MQPNFHFITCRPSTCGQSSPFPITTLANVGAPGITLDQAGPPTKPVGLGCSSGAVSVLLRHLSLTRWFKWTPCTFTGQLVNLRRPCLQFHRFVLAPQVPLAFRGLPKMQPGGRSRQDSDVHCGHEQSIGLFACHS